MTENEATTKWCPMSRSSVEPNGSADNRGIMNEAGCHNSTLCIASECMAWRWNEPIPNEEATIVGTGQPLGDNWAISHEGVIDCGPRKGQAVTGWIRFFPEKRTGHCGLAGRGEPLAGAV